MALRVVAWVREGSMLDQEEAWWLTKLVFRGILIFIILKLVLAFLLTKIEPQPLDLGTQISVLLVSGHADGRA